MTACRLSEALESRGEDQQQESALEKIKRLMKTAENKSRNNSEDDQGKKRTILSALNLFLSLAYERLREPSVVSDDKHSLLMSDSPDDKFLHHQLDVSWLGNIDPHTSNRIPTALEQLRGSKSGSVYLRNIPTLLLFNLIFGRSL